VQNTKPNESSLSALSPMYAIWLEIKSVLFCGYQGPRGAAISIMKTIFTQVNTAATLMQTSKKCVQ